MENFIKLDDNYIFDPFTSCVYKNQIVTDDVRQVIRNHVLELMLDKKKQNVMQPQKTLTNITLIPTMKCEGRCTYCYNSGYNNLMKEDLSLSDLKYQIESLQEKKYIFKLKTISVYGGEPFLTKESLADIFDFFIKNDLCEKDIIINISSGLLFDDDVFNNVIIECQKLIEKNIPFYISSCVDFGTDEKDFTRLSPYTNKQKLIDRITQLYNLGVFVKCSSIITNKTNIQNLEQEILNHYVSYIKSTFHRENFLNLNVRESFAYRLTAVYDNTYYLSDENLKDLFNFIEKCQKEYPITTNIFPYNNVYESAEKILLDKNIMLYLYQPMYCGLFCKSLTLLPNRKISFCHMDPYNSNILLNESNLLYDILFNNFKCYSCDFYFQCRSLCAEVLKNLKNKEGKQSYCNYLKKCFINGLIKNKDLVFFKF